MAKFIKLTERGQEPVYLNPEMISAIQKTQYGTTYGKSTVHTTNLRVEVYETPEQILKLIEEANDRA